MATIKIFIKEKVKGTIIIGIAQLDYLLSCVFASILQILGGGSHRFQSNQPKIREIIFLASF